MAGSPGRGADQGAQSTPAHSSIGAAAADAFEAIALGISSKRLSSVSITVGVGVGGCVDQDALKPADEARRVLTFSIAQPVKDRNPKPNRRRTSFSQVLQTKTRQT